MTYNKAHIRRWITFIDNYFVIFIINANQQLKTSSDS